MKEWHIVFVEIFRAGFLIVVDEEASFNLADDPAVILPETTNFTAWELSNVLYEAFLK